MTQTNRIDVHRPPPADSSDESDVDFEQEESPRTSTDIRQHDQEILEGEEEVERLLTGEQEPSGLRTMFRRKDRTSDNEVKISDKQRRQYQKDMKRDGKREARREKRRRKRGGVKEEESELMYEMEEGHKDSSDSSGNSSEVDRMNLGGIRVAKAPGRSRTTRIVAIPSMIVVAFALLVLGAYRASSHKPSNKNLLQTLSNGTSTFAPTTILISLDGFRADFLHRNITPSMNAFIRTGVSPKYMLPSFPSVTFPNHFTLVTGLYPEAHGVVGNTFWDPQLQEEFYYTDPTRSMQPKWWQGEPLWVTAEDQGVRSAIHMWPGSEAHIGDLEPTYVDKYNGKELLPNKVSRILDLLDLPGPDEIDARADAPRPQLIAAYVPNVDQHGHLYGPNSTEINEDISSVDTMLGDLFYGLEQRNLTNIVNIVIVSDHGMASTDTSRLIQLDDIIDMSVIEHSDGWPLFGLRPKNDSLLMPLYKHLKEEAKELDNFEVYLRDKDMPDRYHFSQNERIAPLWMIPKTGWAIVTRKDFDVKESLEKGIVYHPRGLHGYDHEHPLMRAIFLARGPAFPHTPGSELEAFQNIEVYNIVCDSLGISPKPNNGTLRLPLVPVGIHESSAPADIPDDPPKSLSPSGFPIISDIIKGGPAKFSGRIKETLSVPDAPSTTSTPSISEDSPSLARSSSSSPITSSSALPTTSLSLEPSTTTEGIVASRPVVNDGGDPDNENFNNWWDWVKGKLDGAKAWATDLIDNTSNTADKAEKTDRS